MVKKNSIPGRWRSLTAVGQRIPGSRFIAFKVPLKGQANQRVTPTQKFTPKDLLTEVRSRDEDLGLIIDLTNTERYYTDKDLPRSVQYIKLYTAGLQIPEDATIHQFKRIVRRFIWQNTDNDKLIGVHCTTGINRTGYLICRYLIDVDGWDPDTAVNAFAQARGHPIEGVVYTEDLLNGPTRSNLGIDQPPSEDAPSELYSQLEDWRPEKQSALQRTQRDFVADDYGDFDARKLPLPPPLPTERPKPTKLFEDDKDFLTTMPEYIERVRIARALERQKQEALKISAIRESTLPAHETNTSELHQKRNYLNSSLTSGQPQPRVYNSVAEITEEIRRNRSMQSESGRLVESQSRSVSGSKEDMSLDGKHERFDYCSRRTMDRIIPANGSQSLEFSQRMGVRHNNYSDATPGPAAPYSSHPKSVQNFTAEMYKTDSGKTDTQRQFQYQHASDFSTNMAPLDRNELRFGERQTYNLNSNIPTSRNELQQLLEMQARSRQEIPGLYQREREVALGTLHGQRIDGLSDVRKHQEEKQFLMNKVKFMNSSESAAGTSNYDIRSFQERSTIPTADFHGTNRFSPYQPPMRPQQSYDFLRAREPGPTLYENREQRVAYDYNMHKGESPMDRYLLQDRNRLHLN
ncbi:dual specificity phosphatase 11 (RNA/RNP complex 1-interacting), gene 2 isoform X1 [Xenopus tropicalis]|uniref:RNA/RNP complex-1-interacting phosphatase n=1 Tax=Xenopus tropicalis TaxID=8364 RepID=A0A803KJ62_XENTR|nr:dual specificity phosphatase 11 (RNA/RNP complex 1-interacting), gene 2 isoform X1 [Xenopus tropicalis]|eukprot:XP_012821815.1 PREDICTED: dual specificity phosphatase 11 (RNA/RNP complex 1-interacting), gene 2 isoform X1 [Xenopus tropicalis]